MKKIYKAKSFAKINIGLRVLSRRKDGFHNIETIFYPVKLCDNITLQIEKPDSDKRTVIKILTDKNLRISDKSNICYKAVEQFFEVFKIKNAYKVVIRIKKNIPIGAGLGGGSSNAASVLNILKKHFKLKGRKNGKLIAKIALGLGSDIPFFLNSYASYAAGRGEKLKALPKFKINYKILIVNPNIHISTPWAYKQLKVKKRKLPILNSTETFMASNHNAFVNDFEYIVFKKYPVIKSIKEKMYVHKAVFSLMSGSGSTVYGLFKKEADLKSAQKFFIKKKFKTFIS